MHRWVLPQRYYYRDINTGTAITIRIVVANTNPMIGSYITGKYHTDEVIAQVRTLQA